jgi:hypothetical protein
MDRKDREAGRAEVHTHIGLGPNQDHSEEADPLDELSRGGGGGARARARDFAAGARDRATSTLGRAATGLEERTGGIVRLARENPLATVGIAFAVGFLFAGRSSASGRFGRARQQLRGAIIGAVSAAVAQETHKMTGGASGLLANLFGGGDEEEDEPQPARRTRRPRDY